MNNLFQEMESDFESKMSDQVDKLKTSDLKNVAELSRQIKQTEDKLASLEEEAKQTKKDLLRLTDNELPALMAEIGLSEAKLEDGSRVSVKPTYGATITSDNHDAAMAWLRENDFGDIIKNEIKAAFGAGEDQAAASFVQAAAEVGVDVTQKEGVHHSTLRAWVKERMESGEEFPTQLFSAWTGQRAKIERGGN